MTTEYRGIMQLLLSIAGGKTVEMDEFPLSKIDQTQIKPVDSINSLSQESYIATLAAAFLLDCKARNLSKSSQRFYTIGLQKFIVWCDPFEIKTIEQLTPEILRNYFITLSDRGHNSGGVHGFYRTLRVFLRWYSEEVDPPGWRNPIKKVKPPRVDVTPLPPASMDTIKAMLNTCTRKEFTGERDRAILLFLLDTGVRSAELLALDKSDVDILTGDVLIRKSKSRKPRTVFIGRITRRALRAYLKIRTDTVQALFVTDEGERLRVDGLRQIILRRSRRANVEAPTLHSFRRAFSLALHRAGIDSLSISKLLGHSDINLINRYIALMGDDLRSSHNRGGPVDGMMDD